MSSGWCGAGSSGGWFMSCSGGGRRRCPGWDRAGQVARHGRGLLQSLVQSVAGAAPQGLVRWGRGGRDGRICRVQDRRQRGTPNRDGSDGTAPCRPPCPGHPGPMPAPRPTELHRLDNYRLRMLLIAADFTPNDEESIKPSKSHCKPSCGMLLLCAFLLPK